MKIVARVLGIAHEALGVEVERIPKEAVLVV
jgi:hypothetical protein